MTKLMVHADVRLPALPNYLLFEDGSGKLDVADTTDESLQRMGEAWTAALIAKAQTRREELRGANKVRAK